MLVVIGRLAYLAFFKPGPDIKPYDYGWVLERDSLIKAHEDKLQFWIDRVSSRDSIITSLSSTVVDKRDSITDILENDFETASEETRDSLNSIEDPAERAEKAAKLFGKQSVATGEFLMGNIDLYDELNEKLDQTGIAQEQQATNTDTLQGAIARVKSAWEEFILRLNEGSGIGERIKNLLNFIAQNFTTILSVLGQAIKLWGIYRVITSKAAKELA